MDDEIDGLAAAIGADRDVPLDGDLSRAGRLVHGRAQVRPQPGAGHAVDVDARRAGRQLEILAGPRRAMQQLAIAVDHDIGRAVTLEKLAFGQALQRFLLGGISRRRGKLAPAAVRRRQRELRQPPLDQRPAAEEAMLLVDRAEQPRMARHVLRGAEKQKAAVVQGIVEQGNQPVLQLRREVDQKIAAGDQVELGERRIAQQVVRGEQADLAQLAGDAVGAVLAHEIALQPGRRDVPGDDRGEAAGAGDLQRLLVDVAGEDLQLGRALHLGHVVAQQDGDRIGFLAG